MSIVVEEICCMDIKGRGKGKENGVETYPHLNLIRLGLSPRFE